MQLQSVKSWAPNMQLAIEKKHVLLGNIGYYIPLVNWGQTCPKTKLRNRFVPNISSVGVFSW